MGTHEAVRSGQFPQASVSCFGNTLGNVIGALLMYPM